MCFKVFDILDFVTIRSLVKFIEIKIQLYNTWNILVWSIIELFVVHTLITSRKDKFFSFQNIDFFEYLYTITVDTYLSKFGPFI